MMKILPAGFRFHPTDEELIVHYLSKKLSSSPLPVSIIADVDIYKFDPWDLPAKAEFGEKEWYFFSPRERKYPNGARPNRAAGSGFWKATGTDKSIVSAGAPVGVKKALVFYKGRPPKGLKTNWIMHEYRLHNTKNIPNSNNTSSSSTSMRLDDWVLCRIYKKTYAVHPPTAHQELEEPELNSFDNLLDNTVDYSVFSSVLSDSPFSESSSNIPADSYNYTIQTQFPGHTSFEHRLATPHSMYFNHQMFFNPDLHR